MSEPIVPKLTKWPFYAGDALLLGSAYAIYSSKTPLGPVELTLVAACVGCGALLSIIPFVLEYRAAVKLTETEALADVVSQVRQMETIGSQITAATGRWANVHEEAEKTAAAAKEIAARMETELKGFREFMQQANDGEKATLRLEVEKLRRAESDWLQVLVRILDHVYALHSGAVRSGQANLVEQVGNFQNACRDVARRVGLVPFQPGPAEPFDSKRHQVVEGNGTPAEGASVSDTIATGYTFQGKLLRPALVRLRSHSGSKLESADRDKTSA